MGDEIRVMTGPEKYTFPKKHSGNALNLLSKRIHVRLKFLVLPGIVYILHLIVEIFSIYIGKIK